MKEILYKLYEGLKEYTSKKVPFFELEIRKYSDTVYVIGDNLDDFQMHRVFHAGTKQNQFLIFIHVREPHLVSICHWKNEVFQKEEILTFSHELMTLLLDQSGFEGVLQTDNREGNFKEDYLMKRHVFGEHYQKLYSFIETFIRPDTKMYPDGTFYISLGSYLHLAEFKLASKWVVFSVQKQCYATLQSEEDVKYLQETLQEKMKNLTQLKKEIESMQTNHDLEWKEGNGLVIDGEKFIHYMKIIVINGSMGYVAKVSSYGELFTGYTNGILQLVQDKLKLLQ